MSDTLDTIASRIRRCRRCRLYEGRTRAVPGEGDPHARVICVGEGPGRREDETGQPFVGPSGRFLDDMLVIAGLARSQVFITSVVKCRPPANRAPRADEIETCCRLHLSRQRAAIAPDLLLLMGASAVQGVLGTKTRGMAGIVGRVMDHEGQRVLVTYHPAAGMRFPRIASAMRRHFRRLRSLLAERTPAR
jgi:uracil-DNA glycosylase family 4